MVLRLTKKYAVPLTLLFALTAVYLTPARLSAGAAAASPGAAERGEGKSQSSCANLMPGSLMVRWEDWEVIRDCQSLSAIKGAKLRQLGLSAGAASAIGGVFFQIGLSAALCVIFRDILHFVRDKMLAALHDKDGMV